MRPDRTSGENHLIDRYLGDFIAGSASRWPDAWNGAADVPKAFDRIAYHGITGLIPLEVCKAAGWPGPLVDRVRQRAVAHAMWELSHKAVVSRLLAELARAGVWAVVLKGTALAYDLYDVPASRVRGDTDLLVSRTHLELARNVLAQLGFSRPDEAPPVADDYRLQEIWSLTHGAFDHDVDLHWQAINSVALEDTLDFAACTTDLVPLPRLCSTAMGMSRTMALLLACAHRASHLTTPYFVDGVRYYGGNRLIWLKDIDLLARALSEVEWDTLCSDAIDQGLASVCLDGLRWAEKRLGTPAPPHAGERLTAAGSSGRASTYLLRSRQGSRAIQDVRAIPTVRGKARYVWTRLVPPPSFMRAKYPEMSSRPIALLYLKRLRELLGTRPDQVRH